MTNRYEILDILSQDEHGVGFHALDRETGEEVVVRRFFPFGPDGGGLAEEESLAYEVGVRRLREVSHPSLRKVLNGGVDPDDGMPFLVTEWIEGELLSERLTNGPVSPASARNFTDIALEASIALSEIFGEEAIWLDTDPASVVLSPDNPDRPVTFWISPLRWLASESIRSDLKPLLELVESVSGWRGQVISRNSGDGLGGWVQTLRDHPGTWTLAEAREALHQPTANAEAVTPTIRAPSPSQAPAAQNPATQAPAPQPMVVVKGPAIWPWILAACLAFGAAGILAWRQFGPSSIAPPVVAATEEAAESPETPIVPVTPTAKAVKAPDAAAPVATPAPSPTPANEDPVARMNRLAREMAEEAEAAPSITLGERVTKYGKIVRTQPSQSRKTYYLLFEETNTKHKLWAMFRTADWKGFNPKTLDKMVGKEGRFVGTWRAENSPRKAVIQMKERGHLKLLD